MWRIARGAVLYVGLGLLHGCAGNPNPSSARPASDDVAPHPEAEATGAVESISAADLASGHYGDMVEFLTGRVAGLQVVESGGSITLRIRGANQSMQDYVEPLLVIDDLPVAPSNVTNILRGLRPQEVASVQVLKDVSSTSIYGTRGANGVILVKMKKR